MATSSRIVATSRSLTATSPRAGGSVREAHAWGRLLRMLLGDRGRGQSPARGGMTRVLAAGANRRIIEKAVRVFAP